MDSVKDTPTCHVDANVIGRVVGSFPDRGDWRRISCDMLKPDVAQHADWTPLWDLSGKGGVYAFLYPRKALGNMVRIRLCAKGGSAVQLTCPSASLARLRGAEEQVCLYVGRSANLLARFQQHLRYSGREMAVQVQRGLRDSGLCKSPREAIGLLFAHATIAYAILSTPRNVANRDIAEVTLCGKYRPPFNIKAER
jgi:hypothetical protein